MDKDYWESFYSKNGALSEPTLFALYIWENYLSEGDKLIDLGCGNGRDTLFFAKKNLHVLGVDQCENEIKTLNEAHNHERMRFLCKDFTNLGNDEEFDHIYSRFTMHSINEPGENRVIEWSHKQLKPNGYFFIEARGQENEYYKLGEAVSGENDAYVYENHYRRFINFDSLLNKMKNQGFDILLAEEKTGFAPFKDTDYTFLRIIGRKL